MSSQSDSEKKQLYVLLKDIDNKLYRLKQSIEAKEKHITDLKMHTTSSETIDSDLELALKELDPLMAEFKTTMNERFIVTVNIRNLATRDFNKFLKELRESNDACFEVGKAVILFMIIALVYVVHLSLSKK